LPKEQNYFDRESSSGGSIYSNNLPMEDFTNYSNYANLIRQAD